jgi:hypothetical protein
LWCLVQDLEIVKWTTTSTMSSERLRRLCQVNDYIDYVCLRQVFTGNVCAGT